MRLYSVKNQCPSKIPYQGTMSGCVPPRHLDSCGFRPRHDYLCQNWAGMSTFGFPKQHKIGLFLNFKRLGNFTPFSPRAFQYLLKRPWRHSLFRIRSAPRSVPQALWRYPGRHAGQGHLPNRTLWSKKKMEDISGVSRSFSWPFVILRRNNHFFV